MFLSSDHPADIAHLIETYPKFRELYEEIAAFSQRPEELVNMYSKALEIMDLNTVKYMIEEQKQELEEQKQELEEQARLLAEKDAQLEALRSELEHMKQASR